MKVVQPAMKRCACCGRITKHEKIVNKMSFGEVVGHTLFIVLTGGLWALLLVPYLAVNGMMNIGASYYCTVCGK